MKLKKAEAYIDTVITVFVNLIILYLVLNLFSYMITYQKLNHAADNIVRCAAINGTTDTGILGEDINEYITNEGFDRSKVIVSFDGTEYMSGTTKNVQFGDIILLNIKTKQSFNFIGRTGSSIFDISINKTSLSEKYCQNANIIVSPTPPDPVTEFKRNGIIPNGAVYTPNGGAAIVGNGTNTFPEIPTDGDEYTEGDYEYRYNKYFENGSWTSNTLQNGWGVRVRDTSKTSYGEIVSEIAGKSVNTMYYTFYGCTSLTTAPAIPDGITNLFGAFSCCEVLVAAPAIPNSVIDMSCTFEMCLSLTTAPLIPNSVENMSCTFWYCPALTTVPTIPNSVTNMSSTFFYCTSLTSTIEVNANPTSYDSCLNGTEITGITGSCSQATKDALMATK